MKTNSAELAETRRGYSPRETAEVRARTVGEIVRAQAALVEKNPTRVPLSDLAAVQSVATAMMERCAELGALPNFETLAAALGVSRRGLYDYSYRNPDSPTAQYLDRLRTLWAGMREMAADRGAADVTASIFVLLNSNLGFTNQHTVEIRQPDNPLHALTDSGAAARMIEAIPDEEE